MIKKTPYWMDTAQLQRFGRPKRDLKVDVVIVGGGITGVTAAYLLKQHGASVALLERDRFGAADTGHTTAHVTYVPDIRISELVKTFGRDHAQAVLDAGQAAMDQIRQIVETESIECELASVPAYLHAPLTRAKEDESARLKEDARLAAELGFDATYFESVPLVERPGIRFSNQAKFHPRKYIAGLLQRIAGNGCHVFEQTPADEMKDDPLRVMAGGHTIRCGHIFIATHVPLQGLAGTLSAALFQTKLAPYTTYAVGAKIERGVLSEASFWDTNDPYYYLRIDRRRGHDYAILGGADHKTGQTRQPREHYAKVERMLRRLIPSAEVDHCWSGQVIETNDGLPLIGETAPGQFVATGFSGNGMTFGTLGAMMARDAIAGRENPWRELFDVSRKKLRGGTWDYLRENKDYPYYYLKDRLAKAAATPLRSVKRGQGKILMLNGERVAAYRDEAGKLTVKSAICTHMGCLVRWNVADKTWDCPCHGSRFHATGEVIGGPAESALKDAKTK